MKIIIKVLFYCILVVIVFTLMGFFSNYGWAFEITSHFRLQYFWLLIGGVVLFILLKKWKWVIVATICLLLNFNEIIFLYYPPVDNFNNDGKQFKALFCNFFKKNNDFNAFIKLIGEEKPDFFIIAEIQSDWKSKMGEGLKEYTYERVYVGNNHAFNIGFFSKIPVDSSIIVFWGKKRFPTILATLRFPESTLKLIGTHPVSPDTPDSLNFRNDQMIKIAAYASQQKNPLILLGDLNTTPWSSCFDEYLKVSGLKNSQIGFGIQPTWPTYFLPFFIPLDHCLVSKQIHVIDRRTGPDIGSDHLPIIVDFLFFSS